MGSRSGKSLAVTNAYEATQTGLEKETVRSTPVRTLCLRNLEFKSLSMALPGPSELGDVLPIALAVDARRVLLLEP